MGANGTLWYADAFESTVDGLQSSANALLKAFNG